MKTQATASLLAALTVLGLAACAVPHAPTTAPFSQAALPEAVKVPAGHRVALEAAAAGDITYECRAKKDAAGVFDWAFVGPDAGLKSRDGKVMGKYYGPPATWEHSDGSKVSGAQVAVAPAGAGAIALQLVKANPANGEGVMQGVSYIQRVATQGGVPPSTPCTSALQGQRQVVRYQADYIFWRAG